MRVYSFTTVEMMEHELHKAAAVWFAKGDSDLRSARILLEARPPEMGTAVFHCQQAAEKYLKGWLVFHGFDPPRVHDPSVILGFVTRHDATLARLIDPAKALAPFAVHIRYPGEVEVTDLLKAEQALQHAEVICSAIRGSLRGASD